MVYSHSSTAALQQWPDMGVSVLELSLLRPLRPTALLLTWDEHSAWSPGPLLEHSTKNTVPWVVQCH